MRIIAPVEEYCGDESRLYGHFGSAPCFAILDTESGTVEPLDNQDRVHKHGACNPLSALAGRNVDAVIVGGIGAGALNGLLRAGIRVLRGNGGTVRQAIKDFQQGLLPEIAPGETCGGHGAGHGCGCSHPH